MEIVKSPYLSEKSSDFDEIRHTTANGEPNCSLVTKIEIFRIQDGNVDKGYMTKTANFKNPKWRTAAILKIVKSPYLSEKLSDFDENRYTTANGEPDRSHVTKN